jgi:hypothetical protein
MRPRQTGVHIVKASSASGVTTTELRLEEGSWPLGPLAPATVWNEEITPSTLVIELHRLVRLADDTAIFESYGVKRVLPGGPYSLYAWFTRDQLHVLQDLDLRWQRRDYDRHGDDHCLLTWATINQATLPTGARLAGSARTLTSGLSATTCFAFARLRSGDPTSCLQTAVGRRRVVRAEDDPPVGARPMLWTNTTKV